MSTAAEAIAYLRRKGTELGYDKGGDKVTEAAETIAREIETLRTVEAGRTAYVQLNTRDGEMVLHVEVTEDGGPRILLREGRNTKRLFERL